MCEQQRVNEVQFAVEVFGHVLQITEDKKYIV